MLVDKKQLETLQAFFHTGTRLSFARGEYISGSDETPRGVYLIESGIVKSYDITKYGEENLLIIRKTGEILGLTWALTNSPKTIINTALTPTTVWLVEKDTFNQFIASHPDASLPVLQTLATMYRLHSDRIMTLEYRTVKERLASFLLNLADRFGEADQSQIVIPFPLKQQDIASSISTSRETASRALSTLSQSQIITIEQSVICINQPAKLRGIIS